MTAPAIPDSSTLDGRTSLEARLDAVCRAHGARMLYAFGSRNREARHLLSGGDAVGPSDLDLAALFEPPWNNTLDRELALEDALQEMAQSVRVEVVGLNRAGVLLRARAVSGDRLWAADERDADSFEMQTLAMAGDLAPIERWRQQEEVRLIFEAADAAERRRRGSRLGPTVSG